MEDIYTHKVMFNYDIVSPYPGTGFNISDFYHYMNDLHPSRIAAYEAEAQKVKNWRIEASKKGPKSSKVYHEVVPMEEVNKLDKVNKAKLNWYNNFLKNK